MKLPNFFVVGAIRCGTSSMRAYLDGHPQIFMAKQEPRFFSTDLRSNWAPNPTEREYFDMFRGASDHHVAVGDSSPIYLWSEAAIPNILKFSPRAKIIVMLRPPVEMARSLHQRLVFDSFEDEPDFERAWHLQTARRSGRNIPPHAFEPRLLQYHEVCALGTQLQRMLRLAPRDRVQLVFYDELKSDTRRVYEEALSFLGVSPDGREAFSIVNPNLVRRLTWLHRLSVVSLKAKLRLGLNINLGIAQRLERLNRVPSQRKPIRRSFKEEIESSFRNEVLLLSEVCGRDLSHWIESPQKDAAA